MKQRLLTAAIGIPLFVVVLFFFEMPIYNIAMALVSALAVFEVLHSTRYIEDTVLLIVCCAFAALVPFRNMSFFKGMGLAPVLIWVGVLFAILLIKHEKISFEQIAVAFMMTLVFPFAISTLVFLRDQFGLYRGIYYTMLIFGSSWGADAGAYFVGRFLGRRKLAPKISPHKTVEGFFGGTLIGVGFAAVITIGYHLIMQNLGIPVQVNYIALVVISLFGSLLSVFGDLSASIIKRQSGIKDFGNIFPGHGGIVDRFDSVFVVAPFFYAALQFVTI